jgi:nucleoside-triphosphatase THEP1
MIAYTMNEKKGEMDSLLTQLADKLMDAGHKVAGLVQINTDRVYDHRCDMDVRVLPHVSVLRISQSLGKHARGCRLDTNALETAIGEVERSLTSRTDILIVNKFGKLEAEGRGFRPVIAKAVLLGVPVICGVNALNQGAFEAFSEGSSEKIESSLSNLLNWCQFGGTALHRPEEVATLSSLQQPLAPLPQ